MKWSYPIAKVSGIVLKVHVTFLALLVFVAWMYYRNGGMEAAVLGLAFVSLLFVCVLLHEFGHAFAARAFGIRTPDITLLPIGGVARLERMPSHPMQELIVALAGPAVNVVIALGLWLALGLSVGSGELTTFDERRHLAVQLLQVNVVLIVFNLIPAFPMDGGRVLRALLGMRFSHATATRVAARVGQVIAALFVVAGFFGNPFLVFIGLFVFSGAQAELSYTKMRGAATGRTVGEAMITRFQSFVGSQPVFEAAEEAGRDSQPIFPVTDDRLRVTGMVRRKDLLASGPAGATTVSQLASAVPTVGTGAAFGEAFAVMQQTGNSVLPVVNDGGQVVGLISLNLLSQSARS